MAMCRFHINLGLLFVMTEQWWCQSWNSKGRAISYARVEIISSSSQTLTIGILAWLPIFRERGIDAFPSNVHQLRLLLYINSNQLSIFSYLCNRTNGKLKPNQQKTRYICFNLKFGLVCCSKQIGARKCVAALSSASGQGLKISGSVQLVTLSTVYTSLQSTELQHITIVSSLTITA